MRVLIIAFVLLALFLLSSLLYLKFGWFKRLFHDLMKWHTPDKEKGQYYLNLSLHASCKYCGKDIMQDSQGNWF
jgi:hypothetical protein